VVGRSGGIASSWSGKTSLIFGEPGVFGSSESDGSGESDDGVGCEGAEGWKVADGGGKGVEH
jgi:hypothetical protein